MLQALVVPGGSPCGGARMAYLQQEDPSISYMASSRFGPAVLTTVMQQVPAAGRPSGLLINNGGEGGRHLPLCARSGPCAETLAGVPGSPTRGKRGRHLPLCAGSGPCAETLAWVSGALLPGCRASACLLRGRRTLSSARWRGSTAGFGPHASNVYCRRLRGLC